VRACAQLVAYGLVWFAAPGARKKMEAWRRARGVKSADTLVFPDGKDSKGREKDSGRYSSNTVGQLKTALSKWCAAAPARARGRARARARRR
jgi:hypothetical protein